MWLCSVRVARTHALVNRTAPRRTAQAIASLVAFVVGASSCAAVLGSSSGLAASRASQSRLRRASALSSALALPTFKLDVSGIASEKTIRQHSGEYGEITEVEIVERGDGPAGVFAAKATMKLEANAYDIFKRLCDPEENKRIFDRTCASVNYRNLIEEDPEESTRLFEVSKTGRWRIMGIPVNFESTVLAVEDWKSLEIRFRLKNPGAMKHFSGFWRLFPVGRDEALVLFYQEAVPAFPMPKIFRTFVENVIKTLCGSLLADLRDASRTWDDRLPPNSSPP